MTHSIISTKTQFLNCYFPPKIKRRYKKFFFFFLGEKDIRKFNHLNRQIFYTILSLKYFYFCHLSNWFCPHVMTTFAAYTIQTISQTKKMILRTNDL